MGAGHRGDRPIEPGHALGVRPPRGTQGGDAAMEEEPRDAEPCVVQSKDLLLPSEHGRGKLLGFASAPECRFEDELPCLALGQWQATPAPSADEAALPPDRAEFSDAEVPVELAQQVAEQRRSASVSPQDIKDLGNVGPFRHGALTNEMLRGHISPTRY